MEDQIIKEVIEEYMEKYPEENWMTFEELKSDEIQYNLMLDILHKYREKILNGYGKDN